jgi:hypothetical protein
MEGCRPWVSPLTGKWQTVSRRRKGKGKTSSTTAEHYDDDDDDQQQQHLRRSTVCQQHGFGISVSRCAPDPFSAMVFHHGRIVPSPATIRPNHLYSSMDRDESSTSRGPIFAYRPLPSRIVVGVVDDSNPRGSNFDRT